MDDARAKIETLLAEEYELWYGPQKRVAIDEAVALADEIGDEDLQFKARMALTNCAVTTGDTDAQLSSFAWCLAKYDQDPVRFADSPHGDVLWHYKWAIGALVGSPIFSRAQIEATLDDMEAHYKQANAGLQGVAWMRLDYAENTGRLDQAMDLRRQFLATPRDHYSDCDACTRSGLAGLALSVGDEAEALRLVDEIINGDYDGRHSCTEEPERALSRVLEPMLHAGQFDEARAAHLRSYRLARTNPDLIDTIARHLRFCAITGNEARGLALAERHIGWLTHDALNEAGQHSLLLGLAVALTAVTRAGHGDEIVRGATDPGLARLFGEHDGAWQVADLAEAAWAAAASIAAKFDARNGNSYISGLADNARAVLDEHYDVPIYTDAFLAAPPPQAPEPTDAAGWRLRSRDHSAMRQDDEAVDAARKSLSLSDDQTRHKSLARLIAALVTVGDETEAAALLPDCAVALRALGRDDEADVQDHCGLALFGRTSDDDLAVLEAEVARLDGTTGAAAADVRMSLCAALFTRHSDDLSAVQDRLVGLLRQTLDDPTTRPDQRRYPLEVLASLTDDSTVALPYLAEALEGAECTTDRARIHLARANWLGRVGRFDEGVPEADESSRLSATLRWDAASAEAAHVAGALLLEAGRPEEALTRFRYALRELEQLGEPARATRFSMGRALCAADHPSEAVEVFSEILRLETESDAPPEIRADTLNWLAQAHDQAGQPGFAADRFEEAARLFADAGAPAGAAEMLVSEANLYAWNNQNDVAVEILQRALVLAETEDGQPSLLRVLDRLGFVKAKTGDATGLDDLDRASQLARAGQSKHNAAAVLDTRVGAFEYLGRPGEATSAALTAADAYMEADEPNHAARMVYIAGQFLAEQKDATGAAAILRTALDHANLAIERGINVTDLRKAIALKLGDVYETLGDTASAAEARAQAN